ncbi:MAG: nucleotidyltransferase family protein [Candidatus Latescibacteria bacterium]|nr:nucleotidyltransferase family protein [Candidatus Latescibacterota bacterium]
MRVGKAVILAAGRGLRLHPYTLHTPKPMLRLAGLPLLEHLLRGLRDQGLSQALIITGYLEAEIRAYFGRGATLGLELFYQRQTRTQGTGAALLLARRFAGEEPFLSSWGDALADPADCLNLLNTFERQPCAGLLLLEKEDDPHRGAAIYLEGDRIVRLVEKPTPGTSTTCWNQSGLAIYSPALFACLEQVPLSERGELELTAGVQALATSGEVRGLPMRHARIHLTSPADIPAAEAALRRMPTR